MCEKIIKLTKSSINNVNIERKYLIKIEYRNKNSPQKNCNRNKYEIYYYFMTLPEKSSSFLNEYYGNPPHFLLIKKSGEYIMIWLLFRMQEKVIFWQ